MLIGSFLALQLAAASSVASSRMVPRHEIAVNLAPGTPVLKLPNDTYLINYKYHFNEYIAVRSGVLGSYQNTEGGTVRLDFKLGIEWGFAVFDDLRFFSGLDANFARFGVVGSKKTFSRYGLSPLIGASYFLHSAISLSTEVKLFAFYNVFRDSEAFSRTANGENFEMRIGSIGLLLLGIHF